MVNRTRWFGGYENSRFSWGFGGYENSRFSWGFGGLVVWGFGRVGDGESFLEVMV